MASKLHWRWPDSRHPGPMCRPYSKKPLLVARYSGSVSCKRCLRALHTETTAPAADPWELLRALAWRVDDCRKHNLDLFTWASIEQALARAALKQRDEGAKNGKP
jgi:hypothetical protein